VATGAKDSALPSALERALPLLEPDLVPAAPAAPDGYLDLLGDAELGWSGAAQSLMLTRVVPAIYERLWRPALGRVAKGVFGPGMREEHAIARLLLALEAGDGVLDVACGPGNFTRSFSRTVGPAGLVVGLDGSPSMLARAIGDTPAREYANVAYVRAGAVRLPFRDSSFDAVCCFAALHMFDEPFAALDDMARVLTPGGRIAILTSCRTRTPLLRVWDGFIGARSGQRMFEHDEITGALEQRGFGQIQQRVTGLTQFVGGRLV
jgi:SAM-dependent methyltransferase